MRTFVRLALAGLMDRQRRRERDRLEKLRGVDARKAQREGYLLEPPPGMQRQARRSSFTGASIQANRCGGVVVESAGKWEVWR